MSVFPLFLTLNATSVINAPWALTSNGIEVLPIAPIPNLVTFTLPVTPKDPVISADPVYGNGFIPPITYDAEIAYEAEAMLLAPYGPYTLDDVINDAVLAKDAVSEFGAYDAEIAFCATEADTAKLEVPSNDPVMFGKLALPVTFKDPLTITVPIKVCMSDVASPNWLLPDEYITDADSYVTCKTAIDAVPVMVTSPLMIWVPLKVLLPVVAKYELSYPSNKFEFKAYDDVATLRPVN